MNKKSLVTIKHWQAPVTGLLGLWLAASSWVLGPSGSDMLSAAFVALGVGLVAAAAAMASSSKVAWGAWLTVVLGLVTAVSPWLFGFTEQSNATTNALATGLVAAVLGFMVGLGSSEPGGWRNDRVAH